MVNGLEKVIANVVKKDKTIGTSTLSVTLGGFVVKIVGLSESLKNRLEERYEGFTTSDQDANTVVEVYFGKECFIPPEKEGMLTIQEKEGEKGLYFLSTDFSGYCDKEEKEGFVLLDDRKEEKFQALGIENYLIRIFYLLALKEGGFSFIPVDS